ncbi:putative DNA helicase [Helianthus annuus]|nr:putative DNA helicase [Helianthus annuus]
MSSISGWRSGSGSLRLDSFELLTEPITSSSRASGLVYTPNSIAGSSLTFDFSQSNKLDKNAINETTRESCKQRLLNSLKQTQQRLNNLHIDPEASSIFFENECFKKYGKTGKSFYLSQVASTVRWLSTVDAADLTSRLATTNQNSTLKIATEVEPLSSASPSVSDQVTNTMNEKDREKVSLCSSQITHNDIKLPPIPSFSEFVNKKSSKDSKLSAYGVDKKPDKRSRLQ